MSGSNSIKFGLFITALVIGISLGAELEPQPKNAFAENVSKLENLRQQIKDDLFQRVESAKVDENADVAKICDDLKFSARHQIFAATDAKRLIAEIQFPKNAKKPLGGFPKFSELDVLSPIGQILALIGKDAADVCLEELASASDAGEKEYELFLVVDVAYGPASVDILREKLGEKNPVCIKLLEIVEKAKRRNGKEF